MHLLLALSFLPGSMKLQPQYRFDISADQYKLYSGHLRLGNNISPTGESFGCTNLYFTHNGKPWYPVMGEVHYSRLPRHRWEEAILKMKSAGINVIASYVFWICHEEEKGVFTWNGDNDLREFAKLCAKHKVYFFPRIGPWCHGEMRNGGFPDWVVKLAKTRQNDPEYLGYVQRLFAQIGEQLSGLYFKDGGFIIGVQIENEYGFKSEKGLEHILTLKKMATGAGIDVPYYTATGWPNSDQKQNELIPVWGAYPGAPWEQHTRKLVPLDNFLMNPLGNDPRIGKDLLGNYQSDEIDLNIYQYPFATAEMGGGNQITYHRRPLFHPYDVTSLAYIKTGSGANLMGYYMFHGGINPTGKFSTLQESRQTGYSNYLSIIHYDFQSPIGAMENLRPSFYEFKLLHAFLHDFGEILAPKPAFFPEQRVRFAGSADTVRVAVRAKDNSGFIFLSNYQRHVDMKPVKNFQVSVKCGNEILKVPREPVYFPENSMMIWPFNMEIEGSKLVYSTAQLLYRAGTENRPLYVFWGNENAELVFDRRSVKTVREGTGFSPAERSGDHLSFFATEPGKECMLYVEAVSGKEYDILVLTKEQALQSWKYSSGNTSHLILTDADLLADGATLTFLKTDKPEIRFSVYPSLDFLAPEGWKMRKKENIGCFSEYTFYTRPVDARVVFAEEKIVLPDYLAYSENDLGKIRGTYPSPFGGVLKIWGSQGTEQTFYRKNFTIRKDQTTRVYLAFTPDDEARVYCNGVFLDVFNANNNLAFLNLSNYARDGENTISIELKNQNSSGGLLARIFIVDGENISAISGDTTWRVNTTQSAGWEQPVFDDSGWERAVEVPLPRMAVPWENPQPGPLYGVRIQPSVNTKTYRLSVPALAARKTVRDLFLKLDYRGDMLALYKNGKLAYDDFYYGEENLLLSVNSLALGRKDEIMVQLFSVKPYYKVYVEGHVRQRFMEGANPRIEKTEISPLYEMSIKVAAETNSRASF